jgi:hypothetical protein
MKGSRLLATLAVLATLLMAGCTAPANGGINHVSWSLPAEGDLPGSVEAVEIWRHDATGFHRVAIFPANYSLGEVGTYETLRTGSFNDTTEGATPDSQYRVDMVFAGGKTQPDPITGYSKVADNRPSGVPTWVYLLAGVFVALIIAGAVIYYVLRVRRQKETKKVAYAWESASASGGGIDAATGLPVHQVRCPSCNNPFEAVGNLPLPVECPHCHTSGIME